MPTPDPHSPHALELRSLAWLRVVHRLWRVWIWHPQFSLFFRAALHGPLEQLVGRHLPSRQ